MKNFESKNQVINFDNLSAGNSYGTSETIRALSAKDKEWLAGIVDGDGNFDIRVINNKKVFKSLRITQSVRDSRILYRVKDLLKGGSIQLRGNRILIYTLSKQELTRPCLEAINGNIRIKIPGFTAACQSFDIDYIKASKIIPKNSHYLAGLIDTDGSISYNFASNRIELNIELKQNEFTSNLDFSQVIPDSVPNVLSLIKRNQSANKTFYSIRFSYSTVQDMLPLYKYFKNHRLYSDFKFFRGMQIKRFLELRTWHKYPTDSIEYKVFYNFIFKFFTHLNHKPFPDNLPKPLLTDNEIVH